MERYDRTEYELNEVKWVKLSKFSSFRFFSGPSNSEISIPLSPGTGRVPTTLYLSHEGFKICFRGRLESLFAHANFLIPSALKYSIGQGWHVLKGFRTYHHKIYRFGICIILSTFLRNIEPIPNRRVDYGYVYRAIIGYVSR